MNLSFQLINSMMTADFVYKTINFHQNQQASSMRPQKGQCSDSSLVLPQPWSSHPALAIPAHPCSILSSAIPPQHPKPSPGSVSPSSCKNWAPTPGPDPTFVFSQIKTLPAMFVCVWNALAQFWMGTVALPSSPPLGSKSLLRFKMWSWFIKTNFPQWAKQNTYNGPSGQIISEKACKTNSTAHSETQHMNNKRAILALYICWHIIRYARFTLRFRFVLF